MTMLKDYRELIENGKIDNLVEVGKMCRVYTEGVSAKLKQRFCKDWSIPIKVTAEPYFSERLAIYNQYSACIERFAEFLELLERVDGEQNYFTLYNKTKDEAINYLNENKYMRYFKETEDMNKFRAINGFPSKTIFKQTFIGKKFISIDLRKGNFTALRHYNPLIVGDTETYEEFMAMFTDEPYLIGSKYIRQVIFGSVKPKRQVTYETYLMSLILSDLLEIVPAESVVYVSADEIVLDVDLYTPEMLDTVTQITDKHSKDGITTRVEYFLLKYIAEAETYCKVFLPYEGKCVVEFKCMAQDMMPFVIKALYRNRVTSSDRIFEQDNKLAKWLEPVKISSKGLPNAFKSYENK